MPHRKLNTLPRMPSEQPGRRDHLITRLLERGLAGLASELRSEEPLDPAEGPERLARHAMKQLRQELAGVKTAEEQTRRLNGILADLGEDARQAQLELPPRVLTGIKARSPLGDPVPLPPLPATPLSQSDLLINAEGQPNIGSELRAEIASACHRAPQTEPHWNLEGSAKALNPNADAESG